MVEGVKDNRLPRATTIIRIILSTVGFIIVSVDFFLAKRVGVGICHAESCRIVANSPFAYLIGIPLPMWGMIFFGSLIFTSITQTIFYKLLLLGV
ncbi:MAG: vitamin K epoxide reductase family protein, partial [candidate division WOR-3 bacterium]